MNSVYMNIINETEKIFLKKKTLAILILAAVVPIIAAVLLSLFQNNSGILPFKAAYFPITILGVFTSLFLPLFACMTAADSFAGEFAEKTLKITLLQPSSRFKIYAAKVIALGIFIAASLAVIFVFSQISGLFLEGKESLVQGVFKSLVAYSTAFIPMFMLGIAAVLVAQFFKSSSGALVISIFFYIAAKILSVLFPGISELLITSLSNWHILWMGGSVSIWKLLNMFMFMMSYSIIFLAAGYFMFERKEL